jgi:hypothetical protein
MRVCRENLRLAAKQAGGAEGVKRLARSLGIRDAEWESRGDDWLGYLIHRVDEAIEEARLLDLNEKRRRRWDTYEVRDRRASAS